jgi:hypothetical protein
MDWREQLDLELDRGRAAERSGNSGKVRTAARRAAAIAIAEFQRRSRAPASPEDVLSRLRWIILREEEPADVRAAASRLAERLSADFTSPSTNPLADALLIVNHLRQKMDS